MTFRIRGIEIAPLQPLVGLSDAALHAHNARRVIADKRHAYPDRIELRDAEPGEALLLLSYEHQPARSPYRSSHAIFVLEHASRRYDRVDEIPALLQRRVISARAFDAQGMIVDAALCPGSELEPVIQQLFALENTAYLHLHYAKHGCFACRVDRC
jgi:hypothetical protein